MTEQHSNVVGDHPPEVQQAFLVESVCRSKRTTEGAGVSPLHLSTLLENVRREGAADSNRSSFEVGSGGAQWDAIQGELNALADVRSASPSSKKLGGIKSSVSRFADDVALMNFRRRFMTVCSLALMLCETVSLTLLCAESFRSFVAEKVGCYEVVNYVLIGREGCCYCYIIPHRHHDAAEREI